MSNPSAMTQTPVSQLLDQEACPSVKTFWEDGEKVLPAQGRKSCLAQSKTFCGKLVDGNEEH